MGRYLIKFSYIGSNYRGLQKNIMLHNDIHIHDTDTIQGALESAFLSIQPKCLYAPKITTSSRTDVGVHSLCNTAHIDLATANDNIYNPAYILRYVNRYLIKCHHTIRLLEFIPVNNNFHARIYAKYRTYIYRFMVAKEQDEHRIPISEMGHCYFLKATSFDIERVCKGVELFRGKKNFKSFSSNNLSDVPVKYVRELQTFFVQQAQPLMPYDPLTKNFDFWNIVCSSKGFLYNQVRRMVTALLALGSGKLTEQEINIMLQVPNHSNWNPHMNVVPGYGLYLTNVQYDDTEINEFAIKYITSEDSNAYVKPIIISKA